MTVVLQVPTEPQARALRVLAERSDAHPGNPFVTTVQFGYGMIPDRNPPLKAQGAGRLGGRMGLTLRGYGWARQHQDSFARASYAITEAGREALRDRETWERHQAAIRRGRAADPGKPAAH